MRREKTNKMEEDKNEYHEFDLRDGRHVAFAIIGKDSWDMNDPLLFSSINCPIYRMFLDDEHYPGFYLFIENPTRSWDYDVLEQRIRKHFEEVRTG